ncbi:phosphodiester glycosidase family protein [Gorillibacterium sp. sgz5001074]|uniref:phosphodiester glycosidase family protein n=1 Tax=Gorillibacterium sp. sgz5001074 TaxID=3446695 RepID=UPI003F671A98
MNANQAVNRLFLLATAPFLGMAAWMLTLTTDKLMPSLPEVDRPSFTAYSAQEEAAPLVTKLDNAVKDGAAIKTTIEKYFDMYHQSANEVSVMLQKASAQAGKPAAIFESRIDSVFGSPVRQASSGNIDLKLYRFNDRNYKGYALKANLKSDKAMKLALAGDKIGRSETTLSAVSRLGGIAGVNAGGFADDGNGKRYPTGNTIQNGKYVYGFFPSDDLAFVGLDANRKLVGGKFSRAEELDKLKPVFGASFTPILLKDGRKTTIPVKWMTNPYRAARTVVGNFKNDQILFIVADGVDERGGSGASLAELQDKLQQLGIRDAYNLDGGGSSTLVWGGEVINSPSDGRMRSMPTHFVFFK